MIIVIYFWIGEYIRPEYIQNVYKLGRFIGNCFVTGNSFETYLVAIIVPDFEALLPFIDDPQNGLSDLKDKPKDVIVSAFHFFSKEPNIAFKGDLNTFFEWFCDGIAVCGNYFDHVMEWYRNKNNILFSHERIIY